MAAVEKIERRLLGDVTTLLQHYGVDARGQHAVLDALAPVLSGPERGEWVETMHQASHPDGAQVRLLGLGALMASIAFYFFMVGDGHAPERLWPALLLPYVGVDWLEVIPVVGGRP